MFKRNYKAITLAALLLAGGVVFSVVSCKKKVDTTNYSQFIGDWKISDNCSGFQTPQISIAAGDNSYSLKLTYKMGHLAAPSGTNYDSCQREVTLDGVVNSTAARNYFSMGNQQVTDRCGNNYTVSGGAYIRPAVLPNEHDTLIITMVTNTTGSSTACEFHGYKY